MAGKWHLGHTPPHGPPHRGFDSFMGTPLSHDYGCTNTGGGDIMCPHAEQDVCFPSEPSAADGPTCHIGPNNPWGVAVPFLHNDTIVEQPADLDALADRYADFAADFGARPVVDGRLRAAGADGDAWPVPPELSKALAQAATDRREPGGNCLRDSFLVRAPKFER